MNKLLSIIALLLVPVLLVGAGFYFNNEVLSSAGYVIFIFYIIMAVRGRFTDQKKKQ